jgi:nitrile hydratase accessory protein
MTTPHPDVSTKADLQALLEREALSPLPQKQGEPVFQDSWEAEAYAIGNLLVKEGHLLSAEWMQRMAVAISAAQAAGDPDHGDTYYQHWCAALESFCFDRNWISPDLYQQQLALWAAAIANTPHGVPLALENASAPPCGVDHGHSHAHSHAHGHPHHAAAPPPPHYWTPIHRSPVNPSPPER